MNAWFFEENKHGVILEDDVIVSKKCIEIFSLLLEEHFFNKNIIRLIMLITKGPTRTDEVIEFTDWNKVEKFAQSIDNFQLMNN